MKIQYGVIWQSKPILETLFMTSESGKLRRRCKHNVKQMQPFWDDIVEWIKADKEEHKWEPVPGGDGPPDGDEFYKRFEAFLRDTDEAVEYTPYTFSEELMEFADGITGKQELAIAWLFTENQVQD